MHRYLYILILLLTSFSIKSQNFGNNWINYNQQYYKFKITQEGIYRIDYNRMVSAGIPTGTFDPRSFQVFKNGIEQPIYVKGERDGLINTTDYIEFYATKNDGVVDSAVYDKPYNQANTDYSLYNDTATYFLTWNSVSPLPNGESGNLRLRLSYDFNYSGYTAEPYFLRKSRSNYTSTYYWGNIEPNTEATDSRMTRGEGWFDSRFGINSTVSKTVNTTNIYSTGPKSKIEMVVVGASNYSSLTPDHQLRVYFGSVSKDTLFEGYGYVRLNFEVNNSILTNGSTTFNFSSINGWGSTANTAYMAVSYIDVLYPHNTDLENSLAYNLILPSTSNTGKSFYSFTNFAAPNGDSIFLYDFTGNYRIAIKKETTNYKVLVPNSDSNRRCFITCESQIKFIPTLTPVSTSVSNYAKFTDYTTAAIKAKDYIIVTHPSLLTEVTAYENYRNSTGYKTLVLNINELYDQFCYGIGKHPLAIRNFCKFAISTFDTIPKGLFLVGKSLKLEKFRNNTSYYAQTLVPSFGNPPSDNLFTANINDTLYRPAIATGRLSAKDGYDVFLYKNKMAQYEAAQQNPEEWMKRVLHFGGGSNQGQQMQLAYYLSQYEKTITDTLFGGKVSTFLKSSTAPVQLTTSDSLKILINGGVSMLTFFGHAAGIGFDQSIDHPTEYENFGKYPFLLANSCLAGDLYETTQSSSEEFVLIENKGVIGYLASVTKASASPLHVYSNQLYKNIGHKLYGKTVGAQIQNTIKEIQTPNVNSIRYVCESMTLHGDPLLKINFASKPDYVIDYASVFTNPGSVSTDNDPFTMYVISTNKGSAINDSMIIQIERTLPNNTTASFTKKVHATYYKDTIAFTIPVDIVNGIGLNKFKVTLDAFDNISELSETNNSVTIDLLITSPDIIPIYPYKYAIVPNNQISLKASTGDPFALAKDYQFEMDTTDAFNSPFKLSGIVNHSGGVVTWTPPVTLTDSTVYFWRVSVVPTSGANKWRESSFQYIQGKKGWAQAHFHQFKNDEYQFVSYNYGQRKFKFANSIYSIWAQTGVWPNIIWNEVKSEKNGSGLALYNCALNGMLVIVFDSISGNNWVSVNQGNNTGQYQNYHCTTGNLNYFDFGSSSGYAYSGSWRLKLRDFILNQVPENNYVLAYSHESCSFQADTLLYQPLESIGSSFIRSLPNGLPYIIYGKKGAPIGSAHEVIGPAATSIIQLSDSLRTKWNTGYVLSETIGPSSHWGSLHWRFNKEENQPYDSIRLSVIGIKTNGTVDTVMKGINFYTSKDISNLYDYIDAATYPYIRLIAHMKDDSLRTAPQLKRWQVIFDGLPETALDPSLHYSFNNSTVNQGQTINLEIATHNISDFDMDSLLIAYWVVDSKNIPGNKTYHRCQPHPSGNILIDSISYNTFNMPGINKLWVEVNPNNPNKTTAYDQLEQYHFNNIAQINFNVNPDKINPMLDVTFDGVHILDGDIVSSNPEIYIRLKDENKFMALDDTSVFKVFIQAENQYQADRIYFMKNGEQQIDFTPAYLPDNTCKLTFKKAYTDGKYKLIVQAKDISGNQSGDIDYSINFEVITESSITNLINWPNPFTTATRFVFTITGEEVPDFMKIQIMNISGKVVRVIDISELGPLHIGRNITQYAWDGKDDFGDQLANGVYLYRVVTKLDGQEMKSRESGVDSYLKDGWGKMYLMR